MDCMARIIVGYEVNKEYYDAHVGNPLFAHYFWTTDYNNWEDAQFFFGRTIDKVDAGCGIEFADDLQTGVYAALYSDVMNAKAKLDGDIDLLTTSFPRTYLICEIG